MPYVAGRTAHRAAARRGGSAPGRTPRRPASSRSSPLRDRCRPWPFGRPAAAQRHFENGLALYDAQRDRVNAARVGYDTGTACHAVLGLVLWERGYPDEALRHAQEAIAAARPASHPLSEAWALSHAAYVHLLRGEIALCLEWAEAALALATEQMLPHFAVHAMVCSGWALVKKGNAEQGLARLRAAMDGDPAIGTREVNSIWLVLLADACLETGRIEEGLSAVRAAIAETKEIAARPYEAELNRLEGELLLVSKQPDETRAEASFRNAVAIARSSRRNHGNCGRRRASPGFWRTKGDARKRAPCSRRSTAGSPKASTPPISKRRDRCFEALGSKPVAK